MKLVARQTAMIALMCAFCAFNPLYAQFQSAETEAVEDSADGPNRGIDRWAFKTNAFEWLLTIPNFAFEYDLTGSQYSNWTVGLTAKYNWDESPNMKLSTVFNLLDVRPEFRYWFRYTKKPVRDPSLKRSFGQKFRDEFWTTDRNNPKFWRAQYVGIYADFANYNFKFGAKGIQGYTIGFGASAGYCLPMYQYKKGSIDVELGFSVGLQFCTKEEYAFNTDGKYYTKLSPEGDPELQFTPFPVVSELRASFVWRHKSIKDKIKVDEQKRELRRLQERNTALILEDLDRNLPVSYKVRFDNNYGSDDLRRLKQNDSLYRADFASNLAEQVDYMKNVAIADPVMGFTPHIKKKLGRAVDKREKEVLAEFNKLWNEEKKMRAEKEKERKKQEKEMQKQEKQMQKQQEKAAKKDKSKARKAEDE